MADKSPMSAAINYGALEASKISEAQDSLTKKLSAKTKEVGRSDSLKHSVLKMVATQDYEMARDILNVYVEGKHEFPLFQERARRYVSHGADLIQAIELKRNFPGLASLTFAKQQEIHEGVMKHFEELKQTLTSIQKSEREHKLQDLRSTTWFLKTLTHCLFAIASVGFFIALTNGLAYSFYIVLESITDQLSGYILNLFGW